MTVGGELISWIHTIAACLSLIFGAIVLLSTKGNIKHRKFGLYYFYTMLVNNISALVIMKAFGKWFFPHYLAITCLIVIIPGLISIKLKHKNWLKVHIVSMVVSYYLLVGGAINEVFLHIPKLRPYIISNEPIVGLSHMVAQIIFIGIVIYFLRKYKTTN